MRALVWRTTAVADIAVEHVPEPVPAEREALVRVGCGGICGSDIMIISGQHPRAKPPLVLGHEFMGRVEALPAASRLPECGGLRGRRVVVEPLLSCKTCRPCRAGHEHVCESLKLLGVETDGGFAEFVKAPVERVYPIPDSVSDEEAAIIEPLAVAVHAVSSGEIPGDGAAGQTTASVIGGGPIGLLIAQVLRAAGVGKILVCEVDAYKLSLADKLGFDWIDAAKHDPVQEVLKRTGGRGSDVTFDAAGVSETGMQLIPMTGIRGRIVMVAIHKKPCAVAFRDLAYREQKILGVRIYARGDFQKAIGLAAGKKVDLKPLVTGVYSLDRAIEAFDLARSGKNVCKVLIRP